MVFYDSIISELNLKLRRRENQSTQRNTLRSGGKKTTTAGIEPKSHWCKTRLVLLPHNNNNNNNYNNNNNIY